MNKILVCIIYFYSILQEEHIQNGQRKDIVMIQDHFLDANIGHIWVQDQLVE